MTKAVVISLIGDDRPGIVESIASIVVQHQGDWIESHMANLAGKFAGILRVNLPDQEFEAFASDLKSKTEGLNIAFETASADSKPGRAYKLELLGQDQPGIIYRISSALASNGATVQEMESEVIDASMSGEKLFRASISICLAKGHDIDQLSKVLEDLANELIVDIELE
ncbi:MAG: ACT domain-containing protein [Gammaproteobacteria bacterium]|nr:ACT domain-containing protein [Gammaproteobacteria bacterium]